MDIILKSIDGSPLYEIGPRFEFPTLPAEISVKNGANYQSYKIIGRGNVKIPKGRNCEEISWDGYFYGPLKWGELMMKRSVSPKLCVSVLEQIRNAGKAVTLMCTEVGINRDVTISDFKWKPYGGHGNVKYSISFSQWVDLKVRHKTDVEDLRLEESLNERPEPPQEETAVIGPDDTLWKLTERVLGNGAYWKTMLTINEGVIDESAIAAGKKSSGKGQFAYPYTVVTVPPEITIHSERLGV